MIQDILPYKLNNSYQPDAKPDEESLIVVFKDNKLLLKIDSLGGNVDFPRLKNFKGDSVPDLTYIFSVDEERFFIAEALCHNNEDLNYEIPVGYEFYNLRRIMEYELEPKRYMYAAFTAYHLAVWYNNNSFCGRCGSKVMKDMVERAVVCPKCGNKIYPRINPAVIVGVINGDRILLTKYKTGFAHNAMIAGFTEIGETMEETVTREVMEETGLRVKNLRYYKSQPWGIAGDILIGYFCDVDGDDTISIDESELKYAEWVYRDDIVLQPYDYSLTNEMMKMFKDKKYV
ncbi:MAG: NAD(+) diphosphatase [Lachnospiraceae bacterium]|nr:NAD(+) diphosphatase [Lachnospiraceae bacterium]